MSKILILENLRSVENVGSIFRTGDALGISQIILVGTTPCPLDRFGRKRKDLAKVSLGAEESVLWRYEKEIIPVLKELKDEGYRIISLEQDPRSVPIEEMNVSQKTALIVGNEVSGISKETLEMSHQIAEIKMFGEKESLNVSVATGIALYVLKSKHA